MDNQQEQFERVTTLLKLKRYELPPPGYFDRFSMTVIARIEAQARASWLERFWVSFEARPALAAACGVLVGGLLVTGFVFSQKLEDATAGLTLDGHKLAGEPSMRPSVASFVVPSLERLLPLPPDNNQLPPELRFGGSSLHALPVGTVGFSPQ